MKQSDTTLPCLQSLPDGSLSIALYVQPRAARDGLAGLYEGKLKLRLTTPPVDGKANKAVIAFLAKLLRLPKSSVIIKAGLQSRSKVVTVTGADFEEVHSVLAAHLTIDSAEEPHVGDGRRVSGRSRRNED
ncbi:MAG: DUF167 domain-containing protein [Desulfobulbus sp.]|nr:DUF167 domain-containing protein [Desulfobulbus sp.]